MKPPAWEMKLRSETQRERLRAQQPHEGTTREGRRRTPPSQDMDATSRQSEQFAESSADEGSQVSFFDEQKREASIARQQRHAAREREHLQQKRELREFFDVVARHNWEPHLSPHLARFVNRIHDAPPSAKTTEALRSGLAKELERLSPHPPHPAPRARRRATPTSTVELDYLPDPSPPTTPAAPLPSTHAPRTVATPPRDGPQLQMPEEAPMEEQEEETDVGDEGEVDDGGDGGTEEKKEADESEEDDEEDEEHSLQTLVYDPDDSEPEIAEPDVATVAAAFEQHVSATDVPLEEHTMPQPPHPFAQNEADEPEANDSDGSTASQRQRRRQRDARRRQARYDSGSIRQRSEGT